MKELTVGAYEDQRKKLNMDKKRSQERLPQIRENIAKLTPEIINKVLAE